MRRSFGLLLGWIAVASAAQAHEFWIEPTAMHLPGDRDLTVEVKVGEGFVGETFPFEPRAYKTAHWVGPDSMVVLQNQPLGSTTLGLSGQGDGLHTLAVASFGQSLTHPSLDHFQTFAEEVGAADILSKSPPFADQNGTVPERYRRFSKTLVYFGPKTGTDRRLGFEYEWVHSTTAMTLYSGNNIAAHHPVDVFCKQSDGQVQEYRLETDTNGQVRPNTINAEQCLINAVFLIPPVAGQHWRSDWVSLLWAP